MKKIYTLILICFALSAKADYWTQKADYPGQGSSRPVSFSIGSKGYVGCGENGIAFSDFWEYDPASNTWTQKANYGGMSRSSAAYFSIGNAGYAGLGIGSGLFADFWKYDPLTNAWTQIANFPGAVRQAPVSFASGGKGYMGTGFSQSGSSLNDFWQYDPALNTWIQKANFPGAPRKNAISFSLDTDGYVGSGNDQSYNSLFDYYKYNTLTNVWTPVASYPGIASSDMAAFSINGFGYAGIGQMYPPANTVENDFWQYDAVSNQWIQKATFSGLARDEAAFFSTNNKGYIGLGGVNGTVYYSDFWEYTPSSTTGVQEFEVSSLKFEVAPNPASQYTIISWSEGLLTEQSSENKKIEITVTDAQGKKVYATQLETKTGNWKLETSNYPNGIYFVTIQNGKEKAVKKFIKI